MEDVLIERLGRRIEFSAAEIDSETDTIHEAITVLAGLTTFPKEAFHLIGKISEAVLEIGEEIEEIRGTVAWFKERVATGEKKNG